MFGVMNFEEIRHFGEQFATPCVTFSVRRTTTSVGHARGAGVSARVHLTTFVNFEPVIDVERSKSHGHAPALGSRRGGDTGIHSRAFALAQHEPVDAEDHHRHGDDDDARFGQHHAPRTLTMSSGGEGLNNPLLRCLLLTSSDRRVSRESSRDDCFLLLLAINVSRRSGCSRSQVLASKCF